MKGICFKEPLFHATSEGRKTQTRRIIKPQPLYDVIEVYGQYFNGVAYCEREIIPCYKVGDIVYLKEPYAVIPGAGTVPTWTAYKFNGDSWPPHPEVDGWKNKLFMPEWAARYFIKITAVRAERLQDISDEDCFREGIQKIDGEVIGYPFGVPFNYSNGYAKYTTPREAYAALIDRIDGKGTWDSNPWMFVYDYELLNKE